MLRDFFAADGHAFLILHAAIRHAAAATPLLFVMICRRRHTLARCADAAVDTIYA